MNFKPVLSWDGSRTEYLDYPIEQGRIVIIWFKYGAMQEEIGRRVRRYLRPDDECSEECAEDGDAAAGWDSTWLG